MTEPTRDEVLRWAVTLYESAVDHAVHHQRADHR